jgi:cytochrome P450
VKVARPLNLSDPQLWASHGEDALFALLRREEPVSWQPDPESPGFTRGRGFWAVVRHCDVLAVSTDPRRFSSSPTTSIRDLPPELGEFMGSMLNMDDPRHAAMRRVVSHAFTPRRLQQIRETVTKIAHRLVDEAVAKGETDAVADLAAPLPLQVLCDLMGIPESSWSYIAEHGKTMGLARDAKSMTEAAQALHAAAGSLADVRQREPQDDLTSALVHADVEGQSLTATEIGSFFMLLVVAGTQTTRHAISHGLVALGQHPDQRERWLEDPVGVGPTAVDEIVRWATPVRHFRRTATEDCTLGETPIAAGDKVVVWYSSANRDESVFPDPERFDLSRAPNPHVAFGAGPHYCLGASLARHEISAVFTALLERAPHWTVIDADPLVSSFLNGYTRVDCDFR